MVAGTEQLDISEAVNALVRRIKPQKILLFGSHAVGKPTEGSDVDLCIIVESGRRRMEIMHDAREALIGSLAVSVDILVFFPGEFEARSRHQSTIEHQILAEGRVLYEQ